jgi:hypothetical protein
MDKRYPNKPLLGSQHGRQYDRSLEARSVQLQPRKFHSSFIMSLTKCLIGLTLLTSQNDVLVTVYDVSRSVGQLVHMNNLPYCLSPDEGAGTSCISSILVQHPQSSYENVFLVRLSDEGRLQYVNLAIPGLSKDSVVNTWWSADVEELDAQTHCLRPDVSPLGAQDFSEIDFHLPYDGECSRYSLVLSFFF